ncbi:ABC transporter permease subunit [Neobacillus sp. FSL H8-0543]|uniref:ABC transporter permease n=1 Tax=Neobacillus sp. FSL H8-0543 TaxID=2954672 RepID=UPI003158C679
MNTIQANSYNELQKLLAKKVTKLFLFVAVALPVLTKLLVNKLFIIDWMALPAENINLTLLDLFVSLLLPLFIFIAATDLFTGEGERGTLFQVRPISRIELFLSKLLSIGGLVLVQLLLVWLFMLISSALFDKTFDFVAIASSLGAYLVSWVPLMVIVALAVLIALVINSSVLAISGMIVLYLAMVFIPYMVPNILYMLPTAYLDWYMHWLGDVSFRWIIQTVTYLCSAVVLFLSAGYYMFNRKEA